MPSDRSTIMLAFMGFPGLGMKLGLSDELTKKDKKKLRDSGIES